MAALEATLASFAPADPSLLARRGLLRRSDTKFLLPVSALPHLLAALTEHHRVLLAGASLLARYETLYFDTPSLDFYHDHRRGRRPRHKVRIRHYPDRRVSYFEVKTKTNHETTVKHRHGRPYGDSRLVPADLALALEMTGVAATTLAPAAWTNFHRLTLLASSAIERVTIDLGIHFRRESSERRLDGTVLVEVKQGHRDPRSPAMLAIRHLGGRRVRASKYAAAIALLVPDVRRNRFLPVLRRIERCATCPSCWAPT